MKSPPLHCSKISTNLCHWFLSGVFLKRTGKIFVGMDRWCPKMFWSLTRPWFLVIITGKGYDGMIFEIIFDPCVFWGCFGSLSLNWHENTSKATPAMEPMSRIGISLLKTHKGPQKWESLEDDSALKWHNYGITIVSLHSFRGDHIASVFGPNWNIWGTSG